jgi:hypothetical protein
MCGHCCCGEGTVSLSEEEQIRIASYLGMEPADFLQKLCVQKGKRIEMRIKDGHCVFLGQENLCAIHPVKPFHCRQWPLHPGILNDPNAWEAIKSDCPGFDSAATYEMACDLVRSNVCGC